MKRIHYIAIFLVVSCVAKAQDFQGQAFYFSKTSMDTNFGGRQLSEDQKKAIAERMKSAFEKTFVLTFTKEESLYKEEAQLEAGQGGSPWASMMSGFTSNNYYKNIKENRYADQREFYGKNFLIKDSLVKLEWELVNETKKIGNYTCFKALAKKEIPEIMDWRAMRQRARERREEKSTDNEEAHNSSEINANETPRTEEITAWYTPEIPINQGPNDYWGLPGLILEIQQGRTTLLCTKIVLNAKEKEDLKEPSKGKEVTQEEFDAIAKEKIDEMIEQFRNRRRGGGFGGPRN